MTRRSAQSSPDIEHPVVRTHPHTGKKCLFVNEGYTSRISDVEDADGEALLAELLAHATDERFIYRHRWQAGDLLIWDNCSTQHLAIPDYALPQRRLMERTTVRGSAPF